MKGHKKRINSADSAFWSKKREKGLHILGCMGTHTLTTKYPSFQFVARAQNNWRKSWDEDILYDLQVEESGSD